MSRQVGSPKGAKAKADKLFSLIVRSRGECQDCGRTENLQCAHIISRRFSNTRCDEKNAFCLCAKCHHFFTDHPVAFGIWVEEQIGRQCYWLLQLQAHKTTKVDWTDVAAALAVRWKEIEAS